MVAGVSIAIRIIAVALLTVYSVIWTWLALVMFFTFEAPKNSIGWWVILGNPFLLAIIVGLIVRQRRKINV